MAKLRGFPPSNTIGCGGSMGLSFGTEPSISIGRKWHWLFSGYDRRGISVYTNFVKLTQHPEDSSFEFIRYDYSLPKEVQKNFEKSKFTLSKTEYGTLALFDGNYFELERYEFDCIEAKIIAFEENLDESHILVHAEYASMVHVPAQITPTQ